MNETEAVEHLRRAEELVEARDHDGARAILAEAVEHPQFSALPASVRARFRLELGWLDGASMRLAPAAEHLKAAISDAEGADDVLVEACIEAATIARYATRFDDAHRLAERALTVSLQAGFLRAAANALFIRATTATLQLDFLSAADFLGQALQQLNLCDAAVSTDRVLADVHRELGVVARQTGELHQARAHLAEAAALYERRQLFTGAANVQRELGAVAENIGDVEAARHHYAEAYARYQQAQRPLGMAAIHRRRARLLISSAQGDGDTKQAVYAEADQMLVEALGLYGGAEGDATGVALTVLRRGWLARLDGRYEDCDRLLEEANRLYTALERRSGLSEVALERGHLARDQGCLDEAERQFTMAVELLDGLDLPDAEAIARFNLAKILVAVGRPAEALPHALRDFKIRDRLGRRLPDPQSRASHYENNRHSYAQAMHVAALCADGRAALEVAVAARAEAIADYIRHGRDRLSPSLRDHVSAAHSLQAALARAPVAEGDLPEVARERLAMVQGELERQASTVLRAAVLAEPFGDVAELQSCLPSNGHALLVDIDPDEPRVCWAVWLPASGNPVVQEMLLPERVRDLLMDHRNAASDVAYSWRPRLMAALSKCIIPRGLAAVLERASDPPSVVIVTGSALAPFPFGALPVRRKPLAQRAVLTAVPSLRLWPSLRARAPRSSTGALVFRDPDLPGTTKEIAALRASWDPVDVTDASELRAALSGASRYALVVIGAHGTDPHLETDSPADGSGLGQALQIDPVRPLTAAELLTADLPELVVMAACWSGRLRFVPGVEPLGLPTSALLGGARCVIGGVVDVDDRATGWILARFYRYASEGAPPAKALRSAQLRYRRWHPFAPAGKWAGLICIGDGYQPMNGVAGA
ncbi:CHAT domain-containing protein [Lentzea sp. NPDC004789]